MRKTSWRLYGLLSVGVFAAFVLIDYKISFGFLLGTVFAVLLYYRTVNFCDTILKYKNYERRLIVSRFLGSYAFMAIPLILSAIFPEYFNVLACAAGLLLIKITLVLDSLLERREKGE